VFFSTTYPKRVTQALLNFNKNAPDKAWSGVWPHHPGLTGTSFALINFWQWRGLPMKAHSRTHVDILPKSKKPKKVLKKPTAVSITERYLELRRLRERLSEAEALRTAQ
jgi:hypothetical protein